MIVMNALADLVRYVLGVFPPSVALGLFIPALVTAAAVGVRLAVRKLLVPAGRMLLIGLRWLTIAGAAVALVPEFGVASAYRRAARRPPAAVYTFGDAVAISVATLMASYERLPEPLVRLSRIHGVVIFLAVCAWIWWWNQGQCPTGIANPPACVRPVAAWWSHVGGK